MDCINQGHHLAPLCLLIKLFHETEIGKRISHLHFHLISCRCKNLDCCRLSDARQMHCCEESCLYFARLFIFKMNIYANNYSFFNINQVCRNKLNITSGLPLGLIPGLVTWMMGQSTRSAHLQIK